MKYELGLQVVNGGDCVLLGLIRATEHSTSSWPFITFLTQGMDLYAALYRSRSRSRGYKVGDVGYHVLDDPGAFRVSARTELRLKFPPLENSALYSFVYCCYCCVLAVAFGDAAAGR